MNNSIEYLPWSDFTDMLVKSIHPDSPLLHEISQYAPDATRALIRSLTLTGLVDPPLMREVSSRMLCALHHYGLTPMLATQQVYQEMIILLRRQQLIDRTLMGDALALFTSVDNNVSRIKRVMALFVAEKVVLFGRPRQEEQPVVSQFIEELTAGIGDPAKIYVAHQLHVDSAAFIMRREKTS